jgi:alpha-galactosidase
VSDSTELANRHLTIRLQPQLGTFNFIDDAARTVIAEAAMGVALADGALLSTRGHAVRMRSVESRDDVLGRGSVLTGQAHFGGGLYFEISVTCYDELPFVVLNCGLQNGSPDPIRVARFHVLEDSRLDLCSLSSAWRFYKHGWQSWSPTLVLDCAGEDLAVTPPVFAPATRPEARDGQFVSELMTAIVSPESGQGIVTGFITTGEQMSQVWFDQEGETLTAASYADGVTVPPGGRLSSERLLIELTRAPLEAMERYGDALGRSMGSRVSADVATGWCSWYQYWQGVTEEAVLTNLESLRRSHLPLEYVQIDDGWQEEIGDWLNVNEKFPRGLTWLVERIHEAGFKAGLWLAPFLMGEKSRLWKEHREWAVQYRSEKPFIALQNWGQDCYALDLTRPDVIDWLKTVFRTICADWGFDYVKIDFIYAGAVNGIRHDPEVTRTLAYRRGLEAVREAVGERFILGCGNPMGASIGLVDGARISADVAPFWHPPGGSAETARNWMSAPAAFNAVRNSITRWWMHGRLWQNDPDCLLLRDSETALSPEEVQALATIVAMSGGMILDSDDLTRLSDQRRQWLSNLLPPYGKAARPLDLFASETPRLLELDVGSHSMLALLNWDEKTANMSASLPKESVQVFDAWSRRDLGVHAGAIELEVLTHGCRLLAFRPIGRELAPHRSDLPPLFRWPGS